uniref:Uncharacterized protein n=1 Tax=Brassica campestris TaxID=3711 RepID=M4EJ55_BRACM
MISSPSALHVHVVTPFTDSHEVHSTSCSEIDVTIPMLAAANVAPSNSPIMEAIPSQSIIVEDPSSSANEQQIDPTTPPTHNQQQFYRESEIPVTYGKGAGFDVVGESSGYNLTRGGREIKPTQKFQDMEWTNVSGRVPCLRKAASVAEEYEAAGGEVLVDDEDDDGWLATHGKPKAVHGALDINEKSGIRSIPTYFGAEEEDDDIPDMEEFDEADNVVENDTATLQSTYLVAHEPDDDNILRTRTDDNTQPNS